MASVLQASFQSPEELSCGSMMSTTVMNGFVYLLSHSKPIWGLLLTGRLLAGYSVHGMKRSDNYLLFHMLAQKTGEVTENSDRPCYPWSPEVKSRKGVIGETEPGPQQLYRDTGF